MSVRAEAKQAREKRIQWAERLRVAREIIGSVWREADSPVTLEQPLRDIERSLMGVEKMILGAVDSV